MQKLRRILQCNSAGMNEAHGSGEVAWIRPLLQRGGRVSGCPSVPGLTEREGVPVVRGRGDWQAQWEIPAGSGAAVGAGVLFFHEHA